MDTLLDTDGPVVFTIGGETISIPKATNRDLIPWLTKLHTQNKEAKTKLIPVGTLAPEKYKLLVQIDKEVPTQWQLIDLLNTPIGIQEVLDIVCVKLTDEQKAKVMALPQVRQYELAVRASGLFPASRVAAMFGPQQDELEQHALNLLHPFWAAMKAKGIDDAIARDILLALPGVNLELLEGKPATPESPVPATTFGEAAKNG